MRPVFAPCAVVVLVGLAFAVPTRAQDRPRVGTVTVRTLDVFTSAEAALAWPYRVADAVHVKTRESTVRRFLLFHEGDVYDPERLAETERNLRALRFIRTASVAAGPVHDGVVDVTVTTQDTWTTEPSIGLGRRGGITTFGASLVERNLLGTGRDLELRYEEGAVRTERSLSFTDPNLFGPYRSGWLLHSENSDGRTDRGGIRRPFSSVSTGRAGAISWDVSRRRERIYGGGAVLSEYLRLHRSYRGQIGFALRRTSTSARRLSAGFLWQEDLFRPLPDPGGGLLPEDRRHHYLFLQGEAVANDVVKLDYVDHDSRYQDFNLAPGLSVLLGFSPALADAPRATGLVSCEASVGTRLGPGTLLLGHLTFRSRIADLRANALFRGEARFIHRFGTAVPETLVGRVILSRGWDLDRDMQLFADGETGLRGYRLWAYEGDSSVIVNLEHRIFSGRELLQLVSPGVEIFVDAGSAAPGGSAWELEGLKGDVGLGISLALPRASVHDLLRIDAAWPLSPGPSGRRGLLVSFSSAQGF